MPTPLDLSYATITLTQGQVTIVDTADFEWLNQWKWAAQWNKGTRTYYAVGHDGDYAVRMNRLILGLGYGDNRQGEHISGDTLDNRRSVNLRIATQQQNSWNQKRHSNNTSGFRGVDWNARSGKWRARITVGWDTINLGLYSTPEEAYESYCEAAKDYYGEFARL